jgi:hypothetical protein
LFEKTYVIMELIRKLTSIISTSTITTATAAVQSNGETQKYATSDDEQSIQHESYAVGYGANNNIVMRVKHSNHAVLDIPNRDINVDVEKQQHHHTDRYYEDKNESSEDEGVSIATRSHGHDDDSSSSSSSDDTDDDTDNDKKDGKKKRTEAKKHKEVVRLLKSYKDKNLMSKREEFDEDDISILTDTLKKALDVYKDDVPDMRTLGELFIPGAEAKKLGNVTLKVGISDFFTYLSSNSNNNNNEFQTIIAKKIMDTVDLSKADPRISEKVKGVGDIWVVRTEITNFYSNLNRSLEIKLDYNRNTSWELWKPNKARPSIGGLYPMMIANKYPQPPSSVESQIRKSQLWALYVVGRKRDYFTQYPIMSEFVQDGIMMCVIRKTLVTFILFNSMHASHRTTPLINKVMYALKHSDDDHYKLPRSDWYDILNFAEAYFNNINLWNMILQVRSFDGKPLTPQTTGKIEIHFDIQIWFRDFKKPQQQKPITTHIVL